jgi:ATP-dependent Clp protease adaptor protein ClpS
MRTDVEIKREEKTELDESLSRRCKVFVHNDDITPYDFVILVLVRFFKLLPHDAELVTWTAHNSGIAQVVVLPVNEAQRRVGQAHFAASLEGYPLTFSIEPE